MDENDDRIPLNVNLNEKEKELCNASYSEIILNYLYRPSLFITHLYESVTTLSWKFIS
tara:strand:+ start:259 stop:432 length:174 start_codon:yes stop_codon:yes gene_type:complete